MPAFAEPGSPERPPELRPEPGAGRRRPDGHRRLATAALGVPIALAAVFLLPDLWFFAFCLVIGVWAGFEYLGLLRPAAPHAPLSLLLWLLPPSAWALVALLSPVHSIPASAVVLGGGLLLSVGLGTLLLVSATPVDEAIPALAILAFGLPYLALPVASLYLLRHADPQLVLLVCAVVWLGDAAAYYGGSAWGRHKLAPVVSPNKTWEGAAAGLVVGVAAAAAWGVWQVGRLDLRVVLVGALVAVAGQVGDLVESLLKRGARAKDSGTVLPGHGGVLDRMDAMLFAAPVLLALLRVLDVPELTP